MKLIRILVTDFSLKSIRLRMAENITDTIFNKKCDIIAAIDISAMLLSIITLFY